LGTRLYFVLLGLASASSSSKKARRSFSAISSRLKGAEDGVVAAEDDASGVGLEVDEALSVEGLLLMLKSEAEDVAQSPRAVGVDFGQGLCSREAKLSLMISST
jgi:hypothetical protein